jgi:hypothetical protein
MNANDRSKCDLEPCRIAGLPLRRWGMPICLVLALLAGGVTFLMPRVGLQTRSQARMGWYLRSSQWKADMLTAAAVVSYVLDRENPRALAGTTNLGVGGRGVISDNVHTNNVTKA